MNIPFLKKNDNRGASLVLVIVALLFVGIISVLILKATIGNANAVDTISKSSENFYTTENFVDDLKVYLQNFANQAAVKAYANQLQNIAVTGSIDEVAFQTTFKNELRTILQTNWADLTGSDNVEKITYGAHDSTSGIVFNLGEFDETYDEDTGTLKGIKVSYKDVQTDLSTEIYTDMVLSAEMPSLTWRSSDKPFDYDVDKYVVISNGNVNLGNNKAVGGDSAYTFSGTVKGSLYANGNITANLNGDSEIYSKYIISGGNIDVYNNILKIHGFTKSLLDLKKSSDTYEAKTQENENIWARNINLYGGMTVDDGKIYVEDDISLDGNGSSFEVKGTGNSSIVAYSEDTKTTGSVSDHNNSGAIVINGEAASLDLANLKKLLLAGTAYTEVPTVAGDTADTNAKKYFVQGESITFRALQSMYLVDGSKLWYTNSAGAKIYVGRNPMTATEFNLWRTNNGNTTISSGNASNLKVGAYNYETSARPSDVAVASDCAFDIKAVKYVDNGDEYYYVYWNFASVNDAVNFFNKKYTTTDSYLQQRLSLLNGGSIILPNRSDKEINTKGNLVSKNGDNFGYVTPTSLSTVDRNLCQDSKLSYGNLKSSLSPSSRAGTDLFADALFSNNRISLADTARVIKLDSPASWNTGNVELEVGKDGKGFTEVDVHTGSCISGTGDMPDVDSNTYSYYLVTGKDIIINGDYADADATPYTDDTGLVKFTPLDNAKYIVVSSGNVTINAPGYTFNGIIFAQGNVNVKAISALNCFGNYKETIEAKNLTLSADGNISKIESAEGSSEVYYVSEFDAVLGVSCHDANTTHPNSVLRTLFNVIDTSAGSDSGNAGSEISSVGANNYTKN